MRRFARILIPLILATGCGQPQATKTDLAAAQKQAGSKEVVTLVGTGGSVSIGDPLEQAKKAFPAPKGAQEFNSPMSFAIITKEGWTWASMKGDEAFEAASKNGKIVAMARTGGDVSGEPNKSIARLGEPTKKAVGKTGSIYVWESGDNARFWLTMKSNPVISIGSITVVGNKADVKLLNYSADDPGVFIKQMDAAAYQTNSPEMKKVVEDAKRKAMKK